MHVWVEFLCAMCVASQGGMEKCKVVTMAVDLMWADKNTLGKRHLGVGRGVAMSMDRWLSAGKWCMCGRCVAGVWQAMCALYACGFVCA